MTVPKNTGGLHTRPLSAVSSVSSQPATGANGNQGAITLSVVYPVGKQSRDRREYGRKYYLEHADERREYRRKYYWAHHSICAVRDFARYHIVIPKGQLCERCGEELARHRHHPDYSKPLEVDFLCVSCHRRIHGKRREKMNG